MTSESTKENPHFVGFALLNTTNIKFFVHDIVLLKASASDRGVSTPESVSPAIKSLFLSLRHSHLVKRECLFTESSWCETCFYLEHQFNHSGAQEP